MSTVVRPIVHMLAGAQRCHFEFKNHSTIRSRQTFFSERVINVRNYLPYDILCFNSLNAFKRSIVRVNFKSFYNVTSLVHSYIVITVFLGLVSGLLLVHSGAF